MSLLIQQSSISFQLPCNQTTNFQFSSYSNIKLLGAKTFSAVIRIFFEINFWKLEYITMFISNIRLFFLSRETNIKKINAENKNEKQKREFLYIRFNTFVIPTFPLYLF